MKKLIKRLLPRSLLGRSLLILIVPVLSIQIFTTFMFFDRTWTHITSRLTNAVAGEIAVLCDARDHGMPPDGWDRLTSSAAQALDLQIVFEPQGHLQPRRDVHDYDLMTRMLEGAVHNIVRRPHTIEADINDKWVRVRVAVRGGVVQVTLPQARLFSTSGYIFLLWVIGTSLILLAVAILFMRNQIRPIRRLAVAADRFGRGLDLPASFKPEGAHEIRQAARAFIDMHRRLRRQLQQRLTMLAGVSHDLRTPLTRMKLQAAMLPPGPDVEALKGDIVDMERMIDAYLDFARGDGGEVTARTDLAEMLQRLAANARRQGAQVELALDDDLSVLVRPVAFERAVANIVGNARKYAGRIWLAARREEAHVIVTVDDDGPGLHEDQFEEMFRPFTRGEPSRNPSTGGVGLGLPIAQDIVNAHGGRIWLERSAQGGLRATIRFPV